MTLNISPSQDPAYLAYLRQSGVEQNQVQAEAKARIASMQRALQRRLPTYAEAEKRGLQQTSDNWENNGLFRSGGRLVAQQHVSNDVARQRLEDVAQTQEGIAGTQSDLASRLADLQRQRAEAEYEARYRIGMGDSPLSKMAMGLDPGSTPQFDAQFGSLPKATQDFLRALGAIH